MNSKQVIVLRKDLNMRKGKMIAQGAHASMATVLNSMFKNEDSWELKLLPDEAMSDWLMGKFTKICVSVESEAELMEIYQSALDAGLRAAIITDAGLTEFNGVPTKTAVCIGPNWAKEIDTVTKHLKLL
jgi:PTH2 family peptidyl-tRNA hydrolase